ncbi:MAG: methyl-accepting chemotaxis protein [Rhodocyclales bacterium]|nr:methyl-accepting chemotaxis protein [Rhodocyclales bacterium]
MLSVIHRAPAEMLAGLMKSLVSGKGRELYGTLQEMGVGLAHVCHTLTRLTQESDKAAAQANRIVDESVAIRTLSESVADRADLAAQNARRTREESEVGSAELSQVVSDMGAMANRARDAESGMNRLAAEIARIQQVTASIETIARQTNLLALNASIEAARAGKEGRGFAVVAAEVRRLASEAMVASNEISDVISSVQEHARSSIDTIAELSSTSAAVATTATEVGTQLTRILNDAVASEEQVNSIATDARRTQKTADMIAALAAEGFRRMGHFQNELTQAANLAEKPGEQAFKVMVTQGLDCAHTRIYRSARTLADRIGKVFESAIATGALSRDDLFSDQYKPIANSNPQKYTSRFDDYADRALPSLQEAFLDKNPDASYAIATDLRGYVPTHNNRFCQPLTGNPEKDLVGNRTKRIFNDKTGARCGAHTEIVLVQTYKRDTGEVMHDLSVPIHVNGQHWGGVRVGYPPAKSSR